MDLQVELDSHWSLAGSILDGCGSGRYTEILLLLANNYQSMSSESPPYPSFLVTVPFAVFTPVTLGDGAEGQIIDLTWTNATPPFTAYIV